MLLAGGQRGEGTVPPPLCRRASGGGQRSEVRVEAGYLMTVMEKTHLCRSVPAPGSLPPSHHSPLPLHCRGKKSATLRGRKEKIINGLDCSLCSLERFKLLSIK